MDGFVAKEHIWDPDHHNPDLRFTTDPLDRLVEVAGSTWWPAEWIQPLGPFCLAPECVWPCGHLLYKMVSSMWHDQAR